VDLVDRYGQDCRHSDEALTGEAAQARIDRLLVRLDQLCDGGLCGVADLLVAGEDSERQVVQAGFTAWESLLAAGITRAQDNGDLSPDADPDRLAVGLMAVLQGGLLLARTTRDVGQLETALDMALGYVNAHAVTR
jgi:TetR/AcrR family transcriptional regulator, transcriptional repressor for nem operon